MISMTGLSYLTVSNNFGWLICLACSIGDNIVIFFLTKAQSESSAYEKRNCSTDDNNERDLILKHAERA